MFETGFANKICFINSKSKGILGPYEIHPNIYLSCAENFKDSRLQKTGHGSIAKSFHGRWWYACLCERPLEGTKFCPLGRETAIYISKAPRAF